MTPHRGSLWAWLPLVLLLGVWVNVPVTDRIWIWLEPAALLPVLIGWLASRFGPRTIGLVAVSGLLAVLGCSASHLELGDLDLHLSAGLGYSADVCVLALLAAVAFSRPAFEGWPGQWFQSWRGVGRWLGFVALVLAASATLKFTASHPDAPATGRIADNHVIAFACNALTPLLLLLFLSVFRGREWVVRWKRSRHRQVAWQGLVLVAVVVAAAGIELTHRTESGFEFRFVLVYVKGLFWVLCFLLTTARVAHPRAVVACLTGIWLVQLGISWSGVLPRPDSAVGTTAPWELAFGLEALRMNLVDGVAAALLGCVLAPFFTERAISPLRRPRTAALLGVVLVLEVVGVPWAVTENGFSLSFAAASILGGAAFAAGLVWRSRGLVFPFLVQLGCLLSVTGLKPDHSQAAAPWMMMLGPVTFAFAFFGVLANRWELPPAPQVLELAPKPQATGLSS